MTARPILPPDGTRPDGARWPNILDHQHRAVWPEVLDHQDRAAVVRRAAPVPPGMYADDQGVLHVSRRTNRGRNFRRRYRTIVRAALVMPAIAFLVALGALYVQESRWQERYASQARELAAVRKPVPAAKPAPLFCSKMEKSGIQHCITSKVGM